MAPDLGALTVRLARPSDKSDLRAAVVELHEEERRLYDLRLPGEETAEAYLVWMLAEASRDGAVFIAEAGGVFAGLAAGWIVQENVVEETPDSNRFGYISDVCVLPAFRGRRIAGRLLDALETRLSASRRSEFACRRSPRTRPRERATSAWATLPTRLCTRKPSAPPIF